MPLRTKEGIAQRCAATVPSLVPPKLLTSDHERVAGQAGISRDVAGHGLYLHARSTFVKASDRRALLAPLSQKLSQELRRNHAEHANLSDHRPSVVDRPCLGPRSYLALRRSTHHRDRVSGARRLLRARVNQFRLSARSHDLLSHLYLAALCMESRPRIVGAFSAIFPASRRNRFAVELVDLHANIRP
jgi:hypothetical protein